MATQSHGEARAASDREIVITRVLDTPRALVFKAWTDPKDVAAWWGPRGFTNPVCELDARPRGAIRIDMRGPDGTVYPMTGVFQEVVAPERLALKCAALNENGQPILEVLSTATFVEQRGKTKVTLQARVVRATTAGEPHVKGMAAGWTQSLERLEEYVAGTGVQPSDRVFMTTRVVNAPRDRVFQVWTEREHLMRWFGPKGVTIASCTLDLRPGGIFHYCMRMPDGSEHWGRWVFREIVPPERLVSVVSFTDAAGNVTRAPFNADWPLETLSTVTFAEHAGKGGGTVISVRWTPINAREVERNAFAAGHGSMQQGWGGTLGQLAEYLANAPT